MLTPSCGIYTVFDWEKTMAGINPDRSYRSDDIENSFWASRPPAGVSRPYAPNHPLAWTQNLTQQQQNPKSTYIQDAEKCLIEKQTNSSKCLVRGREASRQRILMSDSVPPLDLYQGWKAKRLATGPSGDCGTQETYKGCMQRAGETAQKANTSKTAKSCKYGY